MPTKRLTDRFIQSAPIPSRGRTEYFDTVQHGLRLRVTDNGVKSFSVAWREGSRQRRYTLGKYDVISLTDARDMASDALREVARGNDPDQKRRRAAVLATERSVEAVVEEFMERHAKVKNRNWIESQRAFDRDILPNWRNRAVHEISRADVNVCLDKIKDRGSPIQANRTYAQLHKFFAWCLSRDYVQVNPASGVERPGKEKRRERVLNDEELKSIWQAAVKLGYPYGDGVRLLMLTGARRSEIFNMERGEPRLDDGFIEIPSGKTKTAQAYDVMLGPQAISIIRNLKSFDGSFLITSTAGRVPFSGFSKEKKALDEKCREEPELTEAVNWTLHDLRRTFATRLHDPLGVQPHIVEACLNHSIKGIAAHYNLASYRAEKRSAVRRWEEHLLAAIEGRATNVVPMSA